jgi:hypothetical protein
MTLTEFLDGIVEIAMTTPIERYRRVFIDDRVKDMNGIRQKEHTTIYSTEIQVPNNYRSGARENLEVEVSAETIRIGEEELTFYKVKIFYGEKPLVWRLGEEDLFRKLNKEHGMLVTQTKKRKEQLMFQILDQALYIPGKRWSYGTQEHYQRTYTCDEEPDRGKTEWYSTRLTEQNSDWIIYLERFTPPSYEQEDETLLLCMSNDEKSFSGTIKNDDKLEFYLNKIRHKIKNENPVMREGFRDVEELQIKNKPHLFLLK